MAAAGTDSPKSLIYNAVCAFIVIFFSFTFEHKELKKSLFFSLRAAQATGSAATTGPTTGSTVAAVGRRGGSRRRQLFPPVNK